MINLCEPVTPVKLQSRHGTPSDICEIAKLRKVPLFYIGRIAEWLRTLGKLMAAYKMSRIVTSSVIFVHLQ
jgi:hypothetical protein